MRSIKLCLVFFLMAFIFHGCETSFLNNDSENLKEIVKDDFKLGEEFVLNFDSAVRNEANDITIEFFDVEEGRCPADVECIWAGNAAIDVLVNVGGESRELILNTHESHEKNTSFAGYNIRLIDLTPYPQSAQNPPIPANYAATLVVESDSL